MSATGIVIVAVMRRIAHLGDWVMHLLSRRTSIPRCRLLVRIPVNVVVVLMVVAVGRVAELIDNVLLVTGHRVASI